MTLGSRSNIYLTLSDHSPDLGSSIINLSNSSAVEEVSLSPTRGAQNSSSEVGLTSIGPVGRVSTFNAPLHGDGPTNLVTTADISAEIGTS